MSVIPVGKVEKIEFAEQHVTPFTDHAVAIGTSSAAVTAWAAKVSAARAAFEAQKAAQNAAKAATITFNDALDAMVSATADILRQIKAQAGITGNSVYSLAEIPAPATPSPKPAPGLPANFIGTLDQAGAFEFTFKCPNPPGTSGTIYQIYRRTSPTGEYVHMADTGVRRFTDTTIPAGSQVTYKVRGIRSTVAGPWAEFNVTFGVNSSGTMTASVAASPKLAA